MKTINLEETLLSKIPKMRCQPAGGNRRVLYGVFS